VRVNENVVALNMQNMLFKNKSTTDSLNRIKIYKNEEDAVELVINEKMKSQIGDINNAEGNSCDDEKSLNEAISTVQGITGILGDIQGILQEIHGKMSLNEEFDDEFNRFRELQQNFMNVSDSEIFNSKWFKNGLKIDHSVVNSFNIPDIEAVKKLAESYQKKLAELEIAFNELKEKIDTGQITEVNLGAAESHIQNIATAEGIVSQTKESILREVANAMLSQANKKPEQVITLLE
jgi:flagellin